MIILDTAFPLHITLPDVPASALASYCPGLKAFQDAIKWSLAQGGKGLKGEGPDQPLMNSGQVSSLVAYTPGLVGTSVREIQMPLGDWKTGKIPSRLQSSPPGSWSISYRADSHSRTVGQMSMLNTLAMATALKPVIMKQGCYSSREFEDFRGSFPLA
jgi:hypothetical protein